MFRVRSNECILNNIHGKCEQIEIVVPLSKAISLTAGSRAQCCIANLMYGHK